MEENDDAIPETGHFWNDVMAWNNVAMHWQDYTTRHSEYGKTVVQILDHGLGLDPERMGRFMELRQTITAWTAELFGNYDLLLTPTLPTEAFAASGPVPRTLYGEKFVPIALTYPFNFSGHPAASVPAGLTDAGPALRPADRGAALRGRPGAAGVAGLRGSAALGSLAAALTAAALTTDRGRGRRYTRCSPRHGQTTTTLRAR